MDYTIYIMAGLFIICVFLISHVTKHRTNTRKIFKNSIYNYTAKTSLMTPAEGKLFITLDHAVRERYYVFPQVHLSAILDHRVNGQEWKYAFKHINGKSVDFVLCDRVTLQPAYAIELDDYTHDQSDRQTRDTEVERMLKVAGIPLVRFKNNDVTTAEIIQALSAVHSLKD